MQQAKLRVIYVALLGGWFIVRGKHQFPLGGRFASRSAAKAFLARRSEQMAREC